MFLCRRRPAARRCSDARSNSGTLVATAALAPGPAVAPRNANLRSLLLRPLGHGGPRAPPQLHQHHDHHDLQQRPQEQQHAAALHPQPPRPPGDAAPDMSGAAPASVLYAPRLWRACCGDPWLQPPRTTCVPKEAYFPQLFSPPAAFKVLPADAAPAAPSVAPPHAKRPRLASAGRAAPAVAGRWGACEWGPAAVAQQQQGGGGRLERTSSHAASWGQSSGPPGHRRTAGQASGPRPSDADSDHGGGISSGGAGARAAAPHPLALAVPRRRRARASRQPRLGGGKGLLSIILGEPEPQLQEHRFLPADAAPASWARKQQCTGVLRVPGPPSAATAVAATAAATAAAQSPVVVLARAALAAALPAVLPPPAPQPSQGLPPQHQQLQPAGRLWGAPLAPQARAAAGPSAWQADAQRRRAREQARGALGNAFPQPW
jgi:hypothetical protein